MPSYRSRLLSASLVYNLPKSQYLTMKEDDEMGEFEELAIRVMALPSKSRAELAELLIQSLEEPDDPEIKSAWLAEIHRRDQEIRAGTAITRPADQVLREAREQLRCRK